MPEYTPAAACAPWWVPVRRSRSAPQVIRLVRCSSTAHLSPESVQDITTLDRYVDEIWRAKLPIANSVDAPALHLVWLTAAFSVIAERVVVGDYVCALQPVEIARRAHLCGRATRTALDELVGAGLLGPLGCPESGYRLSPSGREAPNTA